MARLVLIHWKPTEAKESVAALRKAGHRVSLVVPRSQKELKSLEKPAPDLFVIDLGRLPSQGRDLGVWLRERKTTRDVPLVFAGGATEKVAAIRRLLPDAGYAEWRLIRGAVTRALRRRASGPVVPGVFAGYSGTPLPKKLGFKPEITATLLGAPTNFRKTLGPLPEGVRLRTQARGRADLILLFARTTKELEQRFPKATPLLEEGGSIWLAWPKKASGVATDLTQKFVRDFGLARDFVDYKICAIDETWSGLRFCRRKGRRR